MTLIQLSIGHPIAVVAVMLMVLLFGGVGLWHMPVQLTPHVREPTIGVDTQWNGASPTEVEREILSRQEEALKGLKGLRRVTGTARQGKAVIKLELLPGTDSDHIALLVSNRLNQVGGYPKQVQQPVVWTVENDDEAMAVFDLSYLPGNDRPIDTYGDFIDNVVREHLERVPGVVRVDAYGGRGQELRVVLDPVVLARYRLTVSEVADALRRADIAATLGEINEGKRRYVVEVSDKLTTADSVKNVFLRAEEGENGSVRRVTVGDVAVEVGLAYKNWSYISRYLGQPAISLYVTREGGINVLEAMRGLRAVVAGLNEKELKREGLILKQSYDETVFIDAAVAMVVQNIYVGGLLAAVVLLLFLRSLRATLIVILSIPVSVVGAFIGMALLGRTVNIVSLAGMAFAVGMVVDAAIVVLESIFRLWQEGYARVDAAYTGTRQVWGAILASALTTVMVFVPILTLELEVGQMFRDVAIALSVSVMLSLVVAITVIPALACRLLGNTPVATSEPPVWMAGMDKVAQRFVAFVIGFVRYVSNGRLRAALVAGTTTVTLVLIAWLFLPSFDYLPRGGSYNIIWAVLRLPSGYNLSNAAAIADNIENAMRPLWASETGPESAPGQPPKIDAFFLRAFRGGVLVEATAVDAQRTADLRSVLSEAFLPREPGAISHVFQPSLFQGTGGGERSIDLNISGFDLTQMLETARRVGQFFTERLPVKQGYLLFPQTSLELGAPEVRIVPDPLRLADAGVTAFALVETVHAFNEGLPVLEIDTNDQRIDLVLRGVEDRIAQTQDLGALPIVTENGRILPLSALADLRITA
ncbi:MAG: multidrug resistance protein, partial [Rhodospirillaceae bacterium]